ncbi:2-hydroxyacyl-CoA dehydratase [Candidatus Sumerlaeota bacterium]|nr:2-hydroxyacyl-CoA dehydratase [Candidatus Sumerlaeota bacterium]
MTSSSQPSCGGKKPAAASCGSAATPPPAATGCCGSSKPALGPPASGPDPAACPLTWFGRMIPHCLEYAEKAKSEGRPIVGIMCEYTPRELIMAAGAVPICLCGGSDKTISAAEEILPTNLCPLIKSTYGYMVQGSNPFLEMADLLVAETTCDGKKKMYELMAERKPMYVLELPQKEDGSAALERWALEMQGLKTELETRFGVAISNEKIERAIVEMNRERRLRREIASLMKSDGPPLTGRQLLDLKSSISCIAADIEQYEKALAMFAPAKPATGAEKRVRVLMTGVPLPHGAERVLDLVEGHGGLVVCMENCTGLKPIVDDVAEGTDDPLRALAEKYLRLPCSVMTPNSARRDLLRRLADEYRPQCVVDLVWQACLTYDVESHYIRRLAQEELGIPYLRIETDYSPSDSARIAVRVEALFETVRQRGAS